MVILGIETTCDETGAALVEWTGDASGQSYATVTIGGTSYTMSDTITVTGDTSSGSLGLKGPYVTYDITITDVRTAGSFKISTKAQTTPLTGGYITYTPSAPGSSDGTAVFTATPEPASFLLLGTGLLAFAGLVWRRNSRANGRDRSAA